MPNLSLRCIHTENPKIENAFVNVAWSVQADFLKVDFHVKSPEPIRSSTDFPAGNWGLWEFDVVEIFLRPTGTQTYYEFQLSPLGQRFELEIIEPRKTWNTDYRSQFKGEVNALEANEWTASFEIPLQKVGGETSKNFEGNFNAILGSKGLRTYWSAFLPMQEQPDYHLPQYFKKMS